MSRPPLRARGFTLLEVMVALGILVGALLLVSDIVTGALRNHVRARDLEVATLLARGKMAELEDHYEERGFREADEAEEGSFEEEGHPEVKWKVEVTVPTVEATPEGVLRALTGSDEGLQALFQSSDTSPELAPLQAAFMASLQPMLARLGEQMKRGVRRVKLTVAWPDGGREESFAVETNMVVLQPAEGLPR